MVFVFLRIKRTDGSTAAARGITRISGEISLREACETVIGPALGIGSSEWPNFRIFVADAPESLAPPEGATELDPEQAMAAFKLRNGAPLLVVSRQESLSVQPPPPPQPASGLGLTVPGVIPRSQSAIELSIGGPAPSQIVVTAAETIEGERPPAPTEDPAEIVLSPPPPPPSVFPAARATGRDGGEPSKVPVPPLIVVTQASPRPGNDVPLTPAPIPPPLSPIPPPPPTVREPEKEEEQEDEEEGSKSESQKYYESDDSLSTPEEGPASMIPRTKSPPPPPPKAAVEAVPLPPPRPPPRFSISIAPVAPAPEPVPIPERQLNGDHADVEKLSRAAEAAGKLVEALDRLGGIEKLAESVGSIAGRLSQSTEASVTRSSSSTSSIASLDSSEPPRSTCVQTKPRPSSRGGSPSCSRKPPLPEAARRTAISRESAQRSSPERERRSLGSPTPESCSFVVFVASDGTQFAIAPHLAFQAAACRPPKRCFEFPHMDSVLVGAIVAFLSGPDSQAACDQVQRAGVRRAMQASCVLKLPTLTVFCLGLFAQQQAGEDISSMAAAKGLKWFIEKPVSDWFRLESECRGWSRVDVALAFDLLWYGRFKNDFYSTSDTLISFRESQSRWKRMYAETRIQNVLLSGLTSAPDDELDSWEKFLGPLVTTLDLSNSPSVTDDTIEVVCHFCPNLQVLDVHGSAVTNRSLGKIARHKLPLTWLNAESTRISRDGIDVASELLPSLATFC